MGTRIETLVGKLPDNVDAVMITSPLNRRYYTNFPSSAGTLLATRDKAWFIIDSRYHEAALATVKDAKVILQEKLYKQVSELLRENGVKTLGIEEEAVSLDGYKSLREKLPEADILMDGGVSNLINRQRMFKSQDEIESMMAAQAIADETFAVIREFIAPGVTEKEIELEMELYSRKNGSEEASFSFIVASGPNSSKPHAVPGNRKVESGDFVTMDFGCTVKGYRSDMTRTVGVGQVSDKQRQVYELVLKAQLAALEAIRPGVVCRDVDKVARDIIDGSPYKGMFGHGLGHAVGLAVHENPRFNQEDETVLEPGLVLSVEPGIYLPGEFGVRIEDVVVLTKDGYRNLTNSPKELLLL